MCTAFRASGHDIVACSGSVEVGPLFRGRLDQPQSLWSAEGRDSAPRKELMHTEAGIERCCSFLRKPASSLTLHVEPQLGNPRVAAIFVERRLCGGWTLTGPTGTRYDCRALFKTDRFCKLLQRADGHQLSENIFNFKKHPVQL